ncbi:MAG: hypothetical protein KME57_26515 [Scytonema hyalinum WJT4-NPBG1]|nr:hypothetical protein [Scytonema hyalinum WJT4-NPBG1]
MSPALSAGLSGSRAMVTVEPPLKLNGSRRGLIGLVLVPMMSPVAPNSLLPVLLPIRL